MNSQKVTEQQENPLTAGRKYNEQKNAENPLVDNVLSKSKVHRTRGNPKNRTKETEQQKVFLFLRLHYVALNSKMYIISHLTAGRLCKCSRKYTRQQGVHLIAGSH
jgi:hypothetical protein